MHPRIAIRSIAPLPDAFKIHPKRPATKRKGQAKLRCSREITAHHSLNSLLKLIDLRNGQPIYKTLAAETLTP